MSTNWRDKPASQNQLDLLDQLGVPHDASMTRGEASDLINESRDDDHIFSEDALQP